MWTSVEIIVTPGSFRHKRSSCPPAVLLHRPPKVFMRKIWVDWERHEADPYLFFLWNKSLKLPGQEEQQAMSPTAESDKQRMHTLNLKTTSKYK